MANFIITVFLFTCILEYSNSQSNSLIKLPDKINTIANEELGRWNLDGRSLIFTRLTENEERLFVALFSTDCTLISVEDFLIDSAYNGGGHSISPDGFRLVFTLCDEVSGFGNCDLYISDLENGVWTTPKNMGPNLNGSAWESQPVFGMDGLSIYFASNRPGGFGGSDIWVSRELSPGKWAKPINAGNGINTSNNEGGPFVHFDGRTIYFMRDGTLGEGGYDLYCARMGTNGQWLSAENMGKFINSSDDEGGLSLHPDGKRALITKTTIENQNDLFEFVLPQQFQALPTQALHVNVTDIESGKPIRAQIDLINIDGNDTIRRSKLTDDMGKIILITEHGKSYGLIASAANYILNSVNLVPIDQHERNISIQMIPISSAFKKIIPLKNIFFETGSYSILASSNHELNILLRLLQNNKEIRIEIHGHTDDIGDEENNQLLSEARAEAVYLYLVERGIDPRRLSYIGFGESHPVVDNDTEEGRRLNRRTEFIILEK